MGFPKIENIRSFFKKRRANYITDIRIRMSDGTILAYVPSSALGKRAEKGKTSMRQLKYVRKAIQNEFGSNIEFLIYRGQGQKQLESGLFALLKNTFGETISDCYVSFPEAALAEIWLDLSQSDPRNLASIKLKTIEYLKLFDTKLAQIHWSHIEKEQPSNPVILRAVKTTAPASVTEVQEIMEEKGFGVPSSDWLNGKLDLLRKNGMLIRQENGSYVLTDKGLRLVPHGNFRSSSDIERALALGRRKW